MGESTFQVNEEQMLELLGEMPEVGKFVKNL